MHSSAFTDQSLGVELEGKRCRAQVASAIYATPSMMPNGIYYNAN